MREGWEIRKLGDVCTRITDGSHNPPKGIAHSDFAMISSQNVYNDTISFDDVRYLQEEDFKNEDKRTSVRKGDVLLTIVGTVGRCAVFSVDKRITLQRSVAVLRPQNCLKPRFLMHCLISKSAWLNEEAHGIAQKGLYLKQLAKVSIPVPPIAEQEKIVAELDCLTGIIAKRKQQLEDLDKLAQSIFYDMFGDPITNEKGWEVKKLGEIVDVTDYVANGSFASLRENVSYKSEKDYAILVRLADFSNGFDASKFVYVDEHAYNFLAKSKLYGGEIIMSNVGSIGKLFICPDLGMPMSLAPNTIVIKTPNNTFFSLLFASNQFQNQIKKISSQTALPKFNKTEFKKIAVSVPPLGLQNEFAKKIEAIERKKGLVKQSIVETETLFNSRMDYWFNN